MRKRILKRPMFRMGGDVENVGIMDGMRQRYAEAGSVGKQIPGMKPGSTEITMDYRNQPNLTGDDRLRRIIGLISSLIPGPNLNQYLIDFGWKPAKFTPTGQPIVDEKTLSLITDIPESKLICEYLLLQKRVAQINSWIDAVGEDGRVHGFVIPNGTITGRMTHRNPNMAQVPSISSEYGKECRSLWIVDDDNVLLGVDASGLELRMLAHYMNDKEFTNEIIKGDIHTTNQKAARLKSRNQAKTFIYALMYGAGDKKLGSVVGGNERDGKRAREHFFSNTPAFKSLRDRVQRAATKTYLKGLDGRKLYVRSEHSALNTLLQGAGAIVMKKALVLLANNLNVSMTKFKFVANIHDEWQIEVPKCQANKVGQIAVDSIIAAGNYFNLRCPLDGEFKVGSNWSETH